MKVIGIAILFVSVSALLSCDNGLDNAAPETGSSNVTMPAPDPATTINTEAIAVSEGNNNPVAPVSNISSTALNPAHGIPGHRCDIKVGEPLNSKPATLPSTVNNSVTTSASPSTKPTSIFPLPVINPAKNPTNPATNFTPLATAGLNPPHGQPGHRCDIKVGQPLSGSPVQTTNTTPTANSLPSVISPAITTPANTTPVAPGMNPKHGQPGHVCGIAVGQPLPKK